MQRDALCAQCLEHGIVSSHDGSCVEALYGIMSYVDTVGPA